MNQFNAKCESFFKICEDKSANHLTLLFNVEIKWQATTKD